MLLGAALVMAAQASASAAACVGCTTRIAFVKSGGGADVAWLADSLGKSHDYVSIAQRRSYRVADGRASLVIGQRDPIRSVNDQFIEALFEFEEQLREQSIAVDDDLPFLPDRRG